MIKILTKRLLRAFNVKFIYKLKMFCAVIESKFLSKNGLVVRRILKNKLYLDPADPGISKELILTGWHEKKPTQIFREIIKKGMITIDIGANLGYYALQEASLVGKDGHVYAIEPIPTNYDLLQKNIKLNNYQNVTAYQLAIGNKNGKVKMSLTPQSNWCSVIDEHVSGLFSDYMKEKTQRLTQKTIEVPLLSLDEFLKREKIIQPNLIRMDIEGYEIEAIQGMMNTLRNSRSPLILFFEIHNKLFEEPGNIISPLLKQILLFGFQPEYLIVKSKVINGINRENFVETLCSFKQDCPRIILSK